MPYGSSLRKFNRYARKFIGATPYGYNRASTSYRNYRATRRSKRTKKRTPRYGRRFRGGSSRKSRMQLVQKKRMKDLITKALNDKAATGHYTKSATGNLLSMNNNLQRYFGEFYHHLTAPLGSLFQAFSVSKIRDAVAVMFNGKTADLDYGNSIGNFANYKTEKFHVQYMSYAIKVINFTEVKWDITIYELSPKYPHTDDAEDEAIDAVAAIDQVGGGTAATPEAIGLDIATLPSIQKLFHVKKHKKSLAPGASVSHYVRQGPMDFNVADYYDGGIVQEYQKFSKQFLIRVCPEITNAYDNTSTFSNAVGRFQRSGSIQDRYCLGIETIEKYIFDAPEYVDDANNKDVYCWKTFNPTVPTSAEIFRNQPSSYMWFTNAGSGPA